MRNLWYSVCRPYSFMSHISNWNHLSSSGKCNNNSFIDITLYIHISCQGIWATSYMVALLFLRLTRWQLLLTLYCKWSIWGWIWHLIYVHISTYISNMHQIYFWLILYDRKYSLFVDQGLYVCYERGSILASYKLDQ